jgi:hypothetical protein
MQVTDEGSTCKKANIASNIPYKLSGTQQNVYAQNDTASCLDENVVGSWWMVSNPTPSKRCIRASFSSGTTNANVSLALYSGLCDKLECLTSSFSPKMTSIEFEHASGDQVYILGGVDKAANLNAFTVDLTVSTAGAFLYLYPINCSQQFFAGYRMSR